MSALPRTFGRSDWAGSLDSWQSGRSHFVRKVLIANRGEIAVRVARACRDAGLTSVAIYAEPDLDALHVMIADEAHALGGQSAAESYLNITKILKAAADSGADAVHPGYGFLAENAHFAREVIAAGLTWIGPPPAAITALGDKTQARLIAGNVGAPMAPGTQGPISGPEEAAAFAQEYGLPIAIKAAYGGGGRGLKVARWIDEIAEQYDSAVREAVAAFGRGECFVERYLDRPRHVETQCLADSHGNIVVVSTRDCSLQRRHQKLVEEAPAPFLTAEQDAVLRESSKAILREAGYVGAGTCEFLIDQDGTVSFLEVNTRLQVEHPVTEEVSGIDLVREMFAIADGQRLEYGDPQPRGHSIEFRINAEDPGRGFVPAPGTLTAWRPPAGPGVRVDAGYTAGMTVPQAFDSLIAKLIVTGANRHQALERSRRALAEFEVGGMPTVLPFHRALVTDPAFISEPFTVHTRGGGGGGQQRPGPARPLRVRAGSVSGLSSRWTAGAWKWYSPPASGWTPLARPLARAVTQAQAGTQARADPAASDADRDRPTGGQAAGGHVAVRAGRAARLRTATYWSARCRAPSSRSSPRMASR